ncbi:MAG TPA: hypothetical protein VKV05_02000 [Terriglobales bacterium]|nr:hypothetical protein [Terriglobales bacterium]
MSNLIPLPTPDPMPLPGPVWLMLTLLLVTFLLHLVAMNLTVGGSAIAAFCALRRKRDALAGRLAADLVRVLPISLAFTITLGVAALLFVQVLYGNLLYTSSILIGVFWIAVIPALIVAYYGLYYSKSHPGSSAPLWLSLILLLAIGFIYVNNFTLMLAPQRWLAMYRHSAAGANLNWGEPSLVPRYLHFMLGAFAIAGLAVFAAGVWQRTTEYGQWLLARGSQWFVTATVLNYIAGMWFLLALPRPVLMDLFTGSVWASVLVGLGMLLPLAAVMHALLAARTEKTLLHARLAVLTTAGTLVVMVLLRQAVRTAYVRPFLRLNDLPVRSQWSVIGLFLLLFAAGLATVYAMLARVGRGQNARSAGAATP